MIMTSLVLGASTLSVLPSTAAHASAAAAPSCAALGVPVYQAMSASGSSLITASSAEYSAAPRAGYTNRGGVVVRGSSKQLSGTVAIVRLYNTRLRTYRWAASGSQSEKAAIAAGFRAQKREFFALAGGGSGCVRVYRYSKGAVDQLVPAGARETALSKAGWVRREALFSAAAPRAGTSVPLPVPAPTPAPAAATYVASAFDQLAAGQVDPAAFSRALRNAPNWAASYKDMRVVAEAGRGKIVRTLLKAGTIHSKPSGTSNGAVFSPALPRAVDRACMSYDIRFGAGFDFSLGGKLPGLQGSAPGYSAPTGGSPSTTGWSGRMMWLGPKAYSWAGPSNMAVSYLYHPGQKTNYGDNVRWNLSFTSGVWHTVKQCYVMNTVGRADGVMRAWMDGRLAVNNTSFVYRTRSDVHISAISWAVFRGGATLDWASPRDGYVDLDNVRVTSY